MIMLEELAILRPVDAINIRARNEEHLSAFDELENGYFLERENEVYRIKLLGLIELEEEVDYAKSILKLCNEIFNILRTFYKATPKDSISLVQLQSATRKETILIRQALTYLRDAPIWGSYTSDILVSEKIVLSPSESILKYKTFQELINTMTNWHKQPLFEDNALLINSTPNGELDIRSPVKAGRSEQLLPDWYEEKVPEHIVSLLKEIGIARASSLSALPAMGYRAVIDSVFSDTIGDDISSFPGKLKKLEELRHITPKQKSILSQCIEVGHASIHRGYIPEGKHIVAIQEVIGHLIKEIYGPGYNVEEAYKSTPPRKKKSEKPR